MQAAALPPREPVGGSGQRGARSPARRGPPGRNRACFSPRRVRGFRYPPGCRHLPPQAGPEHGRRGPFLPAPAESHLVTRGASSDRLGLDGGGSKSGKAIFPSLKILPRVQKSQSEVGRDRSGEAVGWGQRFLLPQTPTPLEGEPRRYSSRERRDSGETFSPHNPTYTKKV